MNNSISYEHPSCTNCVVDFDRIFMCSKCGRPTYAIRHGKQGLRCQNCGRTVVGKSFYDILSSEDKEAIDYWVAYAPKVERPPRQTKKKSTIPPGYAPYVGKVFVVGAIMCLSGLFALGSVPAAISGEGDMVPFAIISTIIFLLSLISLLETDAPQQNDVIRSSRASKNRDQFIAEATVGNPTWRRMNKWYKGP